MSDRDTVREIIRDVLGRERTEEIKDDDMLTGYPVKATAEEMVYIAMGIMDRYEMKFRPDDFKEYAFNSINGIMALLESRRNS